MAGLDLLWARVPRTIPFRLSSLPWVAKKQEISGLPTTLPAFIIGLHYYVDE